MWGGTRVGSSEKLIFTCSRNMERPTLLKLRQTFDQTFDQRIRGGYGCTNSLWWWWWGVWGTNLLGEGDLLWNAEIEITAGQNGGGYLLRSLV